MLAGLRIRLAILLELSYNKRPVFIPHALGSFQIRSSEHNFNLLFLFKWSVVKRARTMTSLRAVDNKSVWLCVG